MKTVSAQTIMFSPVLVTIFALADIGGGASPALLVYTASIAAAVRAKQSSIVTHSSSLCRAKNKYWRSLNWHKTQSI